MMSNYRIVLLALAALAVTAPQSASAQANMIECKLERLDGAFKGTCHVPCLVVSWAISVHGPIPNKSCDMPERQSPVSLKREATASEWRGTMEGKFPEDPKLLIIREDNSSGAGVAKTPFGWFHLRSAVTRGDELLLKIDGDKLLAATDDDFKILRRAVALLPNETVWNRNDTRNCPPNAVSLSLFCALIKATEEVSGTVHYRQPAMQVVREVLNEVGGSRLGNHRLMDYNNHPDTKLSEVHELFKLSEKRLAERFR